MNTQRSTTDDTLVTVVVPARNEERCIAQCVASIRASDSPGGPLQLLVVDHSSTDRTASLALGAGAAVLLHQGGSISSVRNRGVLAATGRFLAYVDADCTVPRTWLRSAISLLESDDRVGAVGGPCLCPGEATWVERTFAPRNPTSGASEVRSLATSSFIARTSSLREAGLFNEALASGEDDDMSLKIKKQGLVLISTPECHVVHYGYPRTLRDVVRKERWHGTNQLESRFALDLNVILTHLFLLSTLGFAAILACTAVTASSAWRPALAVMLAGQFTPPLSYAYKRLRSRPKEWRLTPSWLAVGYAYYLGRAWGLVDNYRRRWRPAR